MDVTIRASKERRPGMWVLTGAQSGQEKNAGPSAPGLDLIL